MSQSPLNAERSRPPSPDSLTSDLASLAAALQATAQALLRYCGQTEPPAPEVDETIPPNPRKTPPAEYPDEIRCYRFSPVALRIEQELLEEQDVENLQGLLFNAFSSLTAFISLLNAVDTEAAIDGTVLHLLARELKRTENLLFRIQDAYSAVDLLPVS